MKIEFSLKLIEVDNFGIELNSVVFGKSKEVPVYFIPDTFIIDNIFISDFNSTHNLDSDILYITKIFYYVINSGSYKQTLDMFVEHGWDIVN